MKDDYASKLSKLGDKFRAIDAGENIFTAEQLAQFGIDAFNSPDGYISQHIRDLQKPLYDEMPIPENTGIKELQKANQKLNSLQQKCDEQTEELKKLREEHDELVYLRGIYQNTSKIKKYANTISKNTSKPYFTAIISAVVAWAITAYLPQLIKIFIR